MKNFWRIVDKVINESDIVLMILDARHIEETRNVELEQKVASAKKQLITVINKADLVEKDLLEPYKQKFHPCVFVSAQKFYGMTMLRHMILRYAESFPVMVGVVGYPNTGKSSVINALKGKSSAAVSSASGFTKGQQNIRVDNKIMVIDTPGVIAGSDDKSSEKLKVTASMNVKQDPDLAAYELIKIYKKIIAEFYGVDYEGLSEEEILESIAIKLNRFIKGGEPDIDTAARIILQDWQKAKIQV